MARTPTRRKPAARKKAARTPKRSAVPAVAVNPTPEPAKPATVPEADARAADAQDRAADIVALATESAETMLDRGRAVRSEADQLFADADRACKQAKQLRSGAARQATAYRIGAALRAEQIRRDAVGEARRLLALAVRRGDAVVDGARQRGVVLLAEAKESADRITGAAEESADFTRRAADEHQAEAEKKASDLMASATAQAEELLRDALKRAEEICASAAESAEAVRTKAEEEAAGVLAAADDRVRELLAEAERARANAASEASALTTAAKTEADQERAAARAEAENLKSAAQTVLDDARREATTVTETAQRIQRLAEEDARRLTRTTSEDVRRLTDDAHAEADRVLAQARTDAASVRKNADELLAKAEEKEEHASTASSEAAALLAEASERMRRATSKTEQRLERRRLRRSARDERRTARHDRRLHIRERRRAEKQSRPSLSTRASKFFRNNARRIMVAGPILAPMVVAWTGQAGFAADILGWVFPFTLLFAAAWELSTTFVGWMYHRARKAGDAGTLYRVSTWVFAGGAAVMNFWHASGQIVGQTFDRATGTWVDQVTYWHATPRAVSFAAMSIVGIVLWELYASLIHREHLRAENKVAKARPRIGMIRWFRYPRHAWTAWSLAITDESLDTLERAWGAANRHLSEAELVRRTAGLGSIRRVVAKAIGVADWVPLRNLPQVPRTWPVVPVNGSRDPAEVPNYEVRLDRLPGTPNQQSAEPASSHTAAVAAPVREPSTQLELAAANLQTSPALRLSGARTLLPQVEAPTEPGGPHSNAAGSEPAETESDRSTALPAGSAQSQEQVLQVLNLMEELGYDAVKLPLVQERMGLPKTTAYNRLKDARAEWNRRAAS
ncbi:hypothetical protein [Streptomyces sp. NPDC004267]|uniref:hypothetical protein n=1 Tax=Streptomyces sp. NPDC004267 TaxID=3364694 RepID=UPI00367E95D0